MVRHYLLLLSQYLQPASAAYSFFRPQLPRIALILLYYAVSFLKLSSALGHISDIPTLPPPPPPHTHTFFPFSVTNWSAHNIYLFIIFEFYLKFRHTTTASSGWFVYLSISHKNCTASDQVCHSFTVIYLFFLFWPKVCLQVDISAVFFC